MKLALAVAGILAIGAPWESIGGEPAVSMEVAFEPPKVILGCPTDVKITLTNMGRESVRVPEPRRIAGYLTWSSVNLDASLMPEHLPAPDGLPTVTLDPSAKQSYWILTAGQSPFVPKFCRAGKYHFAMRLRLPGKSAQGSATLALQQDLTIEVEEVPAGEQEAYQRILSHLKATTRGSQVPCDAWMVARVVADGGGEEMREHPTSIFTAFSVWQMTGAKGTTHSHLRDIAYSLGNGPLGVVRSLLCPPEVCPESRVARAHGKQALEWSEPWLELVLKAHPDVWFADELRFRLACDHLAAGDYSRGGGELAVLARTGRPDVANRAAELLAIAKEKSWVK